jgi:hypothetical protein
LKRLSCDFVVVKAATEAIPSEASVSWSCKIVGTV